MLGKKLLLLCLVLLLLPLAFATDMGSVGESTRVWSDVILGESLYTAHNLSLTLYKPNGSIVISDFNMTLHSTGLYFYDFVPNETGNYLGIVEVYNITSKIATGSATIHITENEAVNNMILGIILAVIGLGFLSAYISQNIKLEEIPTGRIVEKALYYSLSFIFLLGTPIFLLIIVQNNSALSYLDSFLTTSVVVTTLVGSGIMIFYFIYHMRKRLERLANIQNEIDDDLET